MTPDEARTIMADHRSHSPLRTDGSGCYGDHAHEPQGRHCETYRLAAAYVGASEEAERQLEDWVQLRDVLMAERDQARAELAKLRAVWVDGGYPTCDMGEIPWRLQRDMNTALGIDPVQS